MHLDREHCLLLPTCSDVTCVAHVAGAVRDETAIPYPLSPCIRRFLLLRVHRSHTVDLYYSVFVGSLFSPIGSVMERFRSLPNLSVVCSATSLIPTHAHQLASHSRDASKLASGALQTLSIFVWLSTFLSMWLL